MADPQGTLMTRGLRSIGNSVEEKTPATGKLQRGCGGRSTKSENPSFMVVNTQPSLITIPKASPATGAFVTVVGKVADERRLQHQLEDRISVDTQRESGS